MRKQHPGFQFQKNKIAKCVFNKIREKIPNFKNKSRIMRDEKKFGKKYRILKMNIEFGIFKYIF